MSLFTTKLRTKRQSIASAIPRKIPPTKRAVFTSPMTSGKKTERSPLLDKLNDLEKGDSTKEDNDLDEDDPFQKPKQQTSLAFVVCCIIATVLSKPSASRMCLVSYPQCQPPTIYCSSGEFYSDGHVHSNAVSELFPVLCLRCHARAMLTPLQDAQSLHWDKWTISRVFRQPIQARCSACCSASLCFCRSVFLFVGLSCIVLAYRWLYLGQSYHRRAI